MTHTPQNRDLRRRDQDEDVVIATDSAETQTVPAPEGPAPLGAFVRLLLPEPERLRGAPVARPLLEHDPVLLRRARHLQALTAVTGDQPVVAVTHRLRLPLLIRRPGRRPQLHLRAVARRAGAADNVERLVARVALGDLVVAVGRGHELPLRI